MLLRWRGRARGTGPGRGGPGGCRGRELGRRPRRNGACGSAICGQGRQGQDVYDAEPAGRTLLGRAVGVLFCSQPVDDGGTVGGPEDLVVEGFGPWGERVPGGDEEALLGVAVRAMMLGSSGP